MEEKRYREYRYLSKADYNTTIEINGEKVRAYSPKKIRTLYSDGGCVIAGETFERKKRDLQRDVGKIELADRKLYLAENGKYSGVFRKRIAYIAVQGGELVVILKRRLLPVILAAVLLLAGLAGGIYGILNADNNRPSEEEQQKPNITPIESTILTVSGRVTKEQKGIENAQVSLQKGIHAVSEAVTDENGNYLIADVEDGYYNLVITQNGSVLTMLASVHGESIVMDCAFPADDLHDVAEITGHPVKTELPESVKTSETSDVKAVVSIENENTPAIAVGKLDTEAMLHMEVGKTAGLQFQAQVRDEDAVPSEEKEAIQKISGDLDLTYYDFSVFRELSDGNRTEESEYLTRTKTVMEIVVPYDSSMAVGTYVFRCHGSTAERLEELAEKPESDFRDGTYYVTADTVHIFTECFSTYAIGSASAGQVTKGFDSITYSDKAIVNLKTQSVRMLYQHDHDSTNDAIVQIYLTDKDSRYLIAESEAIPAGYRTEEIPLIAGVDYLPSVGTYAGLMKIIYLSEDGQEKTHVEIPLTVAVTQ